MCIRDRLHPVYWIDPTEEDAPRQVELAAAAGVVGFKVICGNHYPGDPRAMKTYERMAQVHKSVLFHSGILWDGKSSSRYNRPSEFEDLLPIAGLTFAPVSYTHLSIMRFQLNAYSINT